MHHAEPHSQREGHPAFLPKDREKVPRILIRAMFGVAALSLLLVAYARVTDRPLEAKPEEGWIAEERVVRILGERDGAVLVLDLDGAVIADLGPESGGFISGVSRALQRERAKSDIPAGAPVHLIRYEDGRLALRDELSGWRVELMGFGRDNAAAFARLLED